MNLYVTTERILSPFSKSENKKYFSEVCYQWSHMQTTCHTHLKAGWINDVKYEIQFSCTGDAFCVTKRRGKKKSKFTELIIS